MDFWETWTLTCNTHVEVTIFMKTWNDRAVNTHILPQLVSHKTIITEGLRGFTGGYRPPAGGRHSGPRASEGGSNPLPQGFTRVYKGRLQASIGRPTFWPQNFEIHESPQKTMEIHRNLLKSMEIYEHLRKSMKSKNTYGIYLFWKKKMGYILYSRTYTPHIPVL